MPVYLLAYVCIAMCLCICICKSICICICLCICLCICTCICRGICICLLVSMLVVICLCFAGGFGVFYVFEGVHGRARRFKLELCTNVRVKIGCCEISDSAPFDWVRSLPPSSLGLPLSAAAQESPNASKNRGRKTSVGGYAGYSVPGPQKYVKQQPRSYKHDSKRKLFYILWGMQIVLT